MNKLRSTIHLQGKYNIFIDEVSPEDKICQNCDAPRWICNCISRYNVRICPNCFSIDIGKLKLCDCPQCGEQFIGTSIQVRFVKKMLHDVFLIEKIARLYKRNLLGLSNESSLLERKWTGLKTEDDILLSTAAKIYDYDGVEIIVD